MTDGEISLSSLIAWGAGGLAGVLYVLGWVFPELPMLGTSAVIITIVAATATIRRWLLTVMSVLRVTRAEVQQSRESARVTGLR